MKIQTFIIALAAIAAATPALAETLEGPLVITRTRTTIIEQPDTVVTYRGPASTLTTYSGLDTDSNGYIDSAEFRRDGRRMRDFNRLDSNNDGILSDSELQSSTTLNVR